MKNLLRNIPTEALREYYRAVEYPGPESRRAKEIYRRNSKNPIFVKFADMMVSLKKGTLDVVLPDGAEMDAREYARDLGMEHVLPEKKSQ